MLKIYRSTNEEEVVSSFFWQQCHWMSLKAAKVKKRGNKRLTNKKLTNAQCSGVQSAAREHYSNDLQLCY